jgi:hypothetical protein
MGIAFCLLYYSRLNAVDLIPGRSVQQSMHHLFVKSAGLSFSFQASTILGHIF